MDSDKEFEQLEKENQRLKENLEKYETAPSEPQPPKLETWREGYLRLEAQLKEANEVIDFYGDFKNWSHGSEYSTCYLIEEDDTHLVGSSYCDGRRARVYKKKWGL